MQETNIQSNPIKRGDKSTTLSAAVTERLREDIVSCNFLPGSKLRLDTLKTMYEVGFSPLREALVKLSNEGLVVLEAQRGFQAAPVSERDLNDIMNTRVLLDKVTLAEAVERGDEQWEARIVSSFHLLSRQPVETESGAVNPVWFARHADFHYSLISASDSEMLKRFWLTAYDQAERYRRLAVTYGSKRRNDLTEHEQLMNSALARDKDALIRLSEQHIRKTHDIILFDIGKRLDIFSDNPQKAIKAEA